jgi:Lsr2
MASRTIVSITDDLTGAEGAQTVSFGFEGTNYEIDLTEPNATELRSMLDRYIQHARRVGGRPRRRVAPVSSDGINPKAVRAWAAENGIPVSGRGRIPAELLERYQAAQHRPAAAKGTAPAAPRRRRPRAKS